MNLQVE